MRPVISFGSGVFSVFGFSSVATLFVVPGGDERPKLLIAIVMVLAAPFVAAALSASAYLLGAKIFYRRPSQISSYFIGLACALFVTVAYWLLASELVFFFPIGFSPYGQLRWLSVLLFPGFLASLLTARRAG
jgi:hypothetical protein